MIDLVRRCDLGKSLGVQIFSFKGIAENARESQDLSFAVSTVGAERYERSPIGLLCVQFHLFDY